MCTVRHATNLGKIIRNAVNLIDNTMTNYEEG